MGKRFRGVILCILAVILSFNGCGKSYSGKKAPSAVSGIIDLREWDFEKDGPVRLRGEWDLYWNQLLGPGDFNDKNNPQLTAYINIPEYWNNISVNGKKLPAMGYATHRLRILMPPSPGPLAMRNTALATSFNMYVDREQLRNAGVVGKNRESAIAEYYPGVSAFKAKGTETTVIVQVSNFHHYHGGFGEVMILGNEHDLLLQWERIVFFELFLFGSIIIIGLYHFGVFALLRKDKSPLYFGLFCICIALFNQFSGELFFYRIFLNSMGWAFRFLIVNLTVYYLVPSILMFIITLFPDEINKTFVHLSWVVVFIFSAVALTTPTYIYAWGFAVFQIYLLAVLTYSLICLVKASIRKRQGALIMLAGFLCFFITAVIDALSYNNILPFYVMSSAFGLFIFIFSQSYILSGRFARAFLASEKLAVKLSEKSRELLEKNIALDHDIEERKKTETELENTRNYLSNVFNSLSSSLLSIDCTGIITQWNSYAEIYTGIKSGDAVSRSIWDVIPYLSDVRPDIERVIETGKAEEQIRLVIGKDEKRYLDISVNPLVSHRIEGAVIRIDDVTDIEAREAQLRQAQKMDTIGNLAGGLAHDFNNVLSGVIGTVSLLKHDIESDNLNMENISRGVEIIDQSGRRAAEMVQQLLTLSRRHEISSVPVDLNQAVKNVMRICSNTFDKSIELRPVYTEEKAVIKGDPAQVEQVILNLCVNASHAMTIMRAHGEPQGGVLTVGLKMIDADEHFCEMHPEAQRIPYWVISHGDRGVGIDPAIKDKIFDPFFSTKDHGYGTGLGLSMVYNIVHQHGGFIDVYSEYGSGSTFNVYLPVFLGEHTGAMLKTETVYKGEGLILVVDDEEVVRKIAANILEDCGYTVITAEDGLAGLRVFRERYNDITAVLLDMAMPRMSGRDLYDEMKKIKPDVRVLLSSGFRQDRRVAEALEMGINGFIQKPYSMAELSEKIKDIIIS